jgi:MFS family permease
MSKRPSIVSSISTLSKDTKVLLTINSIFMLIQNFRDVFVPIYLSISGFSPLMIGTYLTISTFASGIGDTGFAILSDKLGRKKVLLINVMISTLYYVIPLLTNDVFLILASAVFAYNGRRSSIVNALLADHSTDEERTNIFTLKLFSGSLFSVLGPMLSGLPVLFQRYGNMDEIASFKPLYVIGVGLTLLCLLLVSLMKEKEASIKTSKVSIPKDQYRIILKLATTHAMDTMAVGITLNIFSLWFSIRYNVGIGVVSIVFTFAQFVESLAYLVAPYVASRVGNVKGTVIIRAFGAFFLFSLAFAPTPMIAAILYATRNAFQRISHPLRQSYMMTILDPKVRASGSGLINIPRLVTMTAGPSIGGYLLELSPMFPPLISGTIFAIGDLAYWLFFKDLKPPEEKIGSSR